MPKVRDAAGAVAENEMDSLFFLTGRPSDWPEIIGWVQATNRVRSGSARITAPGVSNAPYQVRIFKNTAAAREFKAIASNHLALDELPGRS